MHAHTHTIRPFTALSIKFYAIQKHIIVSKLLSKVTQIYLKFQTYTLFYKLHHKCNQKEKTIIYLKLKYDVGSM